MDDDGPAETKLPDDCVDIKTHDTENKANWLRVQT